MAWKKTFFDAAATAFRSDLLSRPAAALLPAVAVGGVEGGGVAVVVAVVVVAVVAAAPVASQSIEWRSESASSAIEGEESSAAASFSTFTEKVAELNRYGS